MTRHITNMRERAGRAPVVVAVGLLVALAVIAAACGEEAATQSDAAGAPRGAGLTMITLEGLPAGTAAAYRFAEGNQASLEQIPCYCGCGETVAHRHLRDCFVNDDGTYDRHASGCGICIAEAQEVQDLLSKGESLETTRSIIDARYARVGTPTDTPPVSSP